MPSVEDSLLERPWRKGSDPRAATCRGKLQSKRSKLNMEINKELMLRAGAENLFKATTNKKLKETVALELSFVNSNLQLLKEQLAELNSSVELYQNKTGSPEIPMIPLGLKETKEIDFRDAFKDFVLEHYSEDGNEYEDSIAEFMDIRQAMRTPARDSNGIALLFEYFNHLYFVERRFFPPDRSLGIFFEWYDSLTGVPSCQRTVAFEKASVLFNIGALYTQIGARQDRGSARGLDLAVDNLLRAAGTFQYIHENFTNAPSMDLNPSTLEFLTHLMCAQARECLFEKSELGLYEEEEELEQPQKKIEVDDIDKYFSVSQEAAHVSDVYGKVSEIVSQAAIKDYVPFSWTSLINVKKEHYKALAHFYVASGFLNHSGTLSDRTIETLQFLHEVDDDKTSTFVEIRVPKNQQEKKYLGKAHLREALLLHEEAMRVNRMCRELRKKDILQEVLRLSHDRSLNKYASIDEEDDFQEVLDPPAIVPQTHFQVSLAFPDFGQHKVQDLFSSLGPIAIFSAKHHWTAPRIVRLRKRDHEGFGFSVRGDAPVIIAGVDIDSIAESSGMKEGDFVVAIADKDVKWSPHEEVVSLIKSSGNNLIMKLVTPVDRRHVIIGKPGLDQQLRDSVSPTSTSSYRSSSMERSSDKSSRTGEGSSPASSVTSGSTRMNETNKKSWGIFKRSARDKNLSDLGNSVFHS